MDDSTLSQEERDSHDLDERFWQWLERWPAHWASSCTNPRWWSYSLDPWYYWVRRQPSNLQQWKPRAGTDELEQHRLHIRRLMIIGVPAAAELLQEIQGIQLVDLTWSESFEATLMVLVRKLDFLKSLVDRDTSGGRRLLGPEWLRSATKRLLKDGNEAYREWQAERRRTLSSGIPERFRKVVGNVWADNAEMRRGTTDHGRRQGRKLRKGLGADTSVIELRGVLRIPNDGFQDVDEAAWWFYDRDPRHRDLGPATRWGWRPKGFSWRSLPALPAIEHVPALGQAARRLCESHGVSQQWHPHVCRYLLRNKLEPVPRQRKPRQAVQNRRQYVQHLVEKYGEDLALLIYNCNLSEKEVDEIVGKAAKVPASGSRTQIIQKLLTKKADESDSWRHYDEFLSPTDLQSLISD